jgi:DNA-binding transcriptional regulator YiaG
LFDKPAAYMIMERGKSMATGRISIREPSITNRIRKLRVAVNLTRNELARLAGVSEEDVNLYERGLPVCLDSRRRMLKVLWAKKVEK